MVFLPLYSKNPPERFPVVTLLLILINILVFLFTTKDLVITEEIVLTYGLTKNNFSPLTFLSSAFLHGDIFHLLGNMWFLYIFGFAVEGRVGYGKYVFIYFLSALLGDVLHLGLSQALDPNMPSIGASGAIFGIFGCALYLFPFSQIRSLVGIFYYWRVITIQMLWLGIIYIGIEVFFAFVLDREGSGGVANLAHIGGAIGGFFSCMAFRVHRDSYHVSSAKAMLSEVKDMRYLSRNELESMASVNPNNTAVLLNLIEKTKRDGKNLDQKTIESFYRLLPQMMRTESIQSVGYALTAVFEQTGRVDAKLAFDMAMRLESVKDYELSLRFYQYILHNSETTHQDMESALYRYALILETQYNDIFRAREAYMELIKRFPLSPFSDQAKSRLNNLKTR